MQAHVQYIYTQTAYDYIYWHLHTNVCIKLIIWCILKACIWCYFILTMETFYPRNVQFRNIYEISSTVLHSNHINNRIHLVTQ